MSDTKTLTTEDIEAHDEDMMLHECPECAAIFEQAKRVPDLELVRDGLDEMVADYRKVAEAALAYRRGWVAYYDGDNPFGPLPDPVDLDAALAAVGMKVGE
jgi:hypothetical protein